MKVYVVVFGKYEMESIIGVFKSEEKARKKIEKLVDSIMEKTTRASREYCRDHYSIEETEMEE